MFNFPYHINWLNWIRRFQSITTNIIPEEFSRIQNCWKYLPIYVLQFDLSILCFQWIPYPKVNNRNSEWESKKLYIFIRQEEMMYVYENPLNRHPYLLNLNKYEIFRTEDVLMIYYFLLLRLLLNTVKTYCWSRIYTDPMRAHCFWNCLYIALLSTKWAGISVYILPKYIIVCVSKCSINYLCWYVREI